MKKQCKSGPLVIQLQLQLVIEGPLTAQKRLIFPVKNPLTDPKTNKQPKNRVFYTMQTHLTK